MRKLMSKARWIISLVVILATMMGLLAMTVFASTAYLVGTASGGYVVHGNLPDGSKWAGTLKVTLDGGSEIYEVYCANLAINWCPDKDHTQGSDTINEHVIWILNNYYPHVPTEPAGLIPAKKAAAVQLAIWHFTDNLDISSGGSPADIFDAARTIIAAAQTASVPETPTTLTLEPSSDSNPVGFLHTVTATLKDQNDDPLSGKTVNFTVTGVNPTSGSDVTNSSGQATFTYIGSTAGSDTITATVTYTVPLGLRWISSGCQDLIMAEEAPGQVSASATKEWYTVTNPGSIGDYVWVDEPSANGIQDGTESGLSGIRVYLYEDENGNGAIDAEDNKLAETTTASGGNYLFTNLPAGNYIVKVDDTDVGNEGLSPVPRYQGGDTTKDSNGSTSIPYTSESVSLAAGENNLTIDFGYYSPPTAVTLSSFAARSSVDGSASWLWLGLVGLTTLAAGSLFWAKRLT